MQLHGSWPSALAEAERACQLLADKGPLVGMAFYQLGKLHRLRGEFQQAEQAYRDACHRGYEPQPGLSFLRLAEGRVDSAKAAIRRVMDEASDVQGPAGETSRSKLLGAYVEIMIAANDLEAAHTAADELSTTAAKLDAPYLHATSAEAAGSILLAEGQARVAIDALRQAYTLWQDLEAPYDTARVRLLMAVACQQLGDQDTAKLHLDAARSTFTELGATPDLARVKELSGKVAAKAAFGLTARELEVLALVAAGKTNQQPGVAALKRWGLLDRLAATGCPPITHYSLDFGPIKIKGSLQPYDGVSRAYCPRRTVLDDLLVEAAVAAGAELRERFTVEEVVFDADRVTGVRGHTAGGRTVPSGLEW